MKPFFAGAIEGKRGETVTSGLCGTVSEVKQAVLVCQTEGDYRVRQDIAEALGIKTALGAPIYQNGKLFAVLMILNRVDGALFDDQSKVQLIDYVDRLVL